MQNEIHNGFESLSSPSTYLPAFSRMPILEWEIWPIGSHQPIYWHIFTHFPKKWLWVPFEPIKLSTGNFTDAHSGMGNLTNLVPSTYLLAHFHALSQKNGFQHLSSPSNYLPAFSQIYIHELEIRPSGYHQCIYWYICFVIIPILSTGAILQFM